MNWFDRKTRSSEGKLDDDLINKPMSLFSHSLGKKAMKNS